MSFKNKKQKYHMLEIASYHQLPFSGAFQDLLMCHKEERPLSFTLGQISKSQILLKYEIKEQTNVWSPSTFSECCWKPAGAIFLPGGAQRHLFASSALPRQAPFCQRAPLLPSVPRQQNGAGCWREGLWKFILLSEMIFLPQHKAV